MPLDKHVVNIPFTGGLDSKTSEIVRTNGANIVATSVRQLKRGEWRQSMGYSSVQPNNSGEPFVMIAPTGNEPLGSESGLLGVVNSMAENLSLNTFCVGLFQLKNSSAVQAGAQTQQRLVAPTVWKRRREAVSQQNTGTGTASPIVKAQNPGFATGFDSGGSARYYAYAYELVQGAATQICITVTNEDTGQCVYQSALLFGTTHSRPRVAYAGNGRFVVAALNSSTNAVDGFVLLVSASTGTVTPTAVANMITGLRAASPYIDAMSYTADLVGIIGVDSSTSSVKFGVLKASTATMQAVTFPTPVSANSAVSSVAFLGDPYSTNIYYVAFSGGGSTRVASWNAVGAVNFNDAAMAFNATNIAGLASRNLGDWCIYVDDSSGTLRGVARVSGVVGGVSSLSAAGSYYRLDSQAWTAPIANGLGNEQTHVIVGYHSTDSTDPQDTYYELSGNVFGGIVQMYQAHLVPLNAGPAANASCLAQVSRRATYSWSMMLRTFQRITRAGATPTYTYGLDTFTATVCSGVPNVNGSDMLLLDHGDYCQVGANTILPFGPCVQVGGQLVGLLGPLRIPKKLGLSQGAGGALTLLGSYLYIAVDTLIDPFGNIYRGAPSTPAAITMTGANGTVTVTAECSDSANGFRCKTEFFRTAAGGTVYQKIAEYEPGAGQPLGSTFTFNDTMSDTTLSSGDFLYSIGEIANGIPPRMSHMCVSNQRLWGIDADNPQRVCFTKKFRRGFLPEFVDTFVVDMSDDQGDLTGIQQLDDRVVAFKGNAIYVIQGDGPDLTGAGAPPTYTRIQTDIGSVPGAVQCSTGNEVWFFAPRQGIWKIDRGLQVSYAGAGVDSFLVTGDSPSPVLTVDTITDTLVAADRNEIWFVGAHTLYVYDQINNAWVTDSPDTTTSYAINSVFYDGASAIVAASDGRVLSDNASNGVANNTGQIQTAWISSADLDGWLRLWRLRFLGGQNYLSAQLNATITVDFDYVAAGPKSFTVAATLNANARLETEVRCSVKCSSFRVTFSWNATNGQTVQLSGVVAEIGVIPGMRHLPPTQRT